MKFFPIPLEFVTRNIHTNVMINFEFYENQCNDSLTVRKEFHENQCNESLSVRKSVNGSKVTRVRWNGVTF